jgi:lysophospholipase L1-like esterase
MYLASGEQKEIIFLGDSITAKCEWSKLFSNPFVRNLGISGDKTDGVLSRLSEVTKSKPTKVFIMIGVNDIRSKVSDSTIIKNYVHFFDKIKLESPNTKVYLQSILPVNNDIGASKTTNERVNKLNNLLKEIALRFKIYIKS